MLAFERVTSCVFLIELLLQKIALYDKRWETSKLLSIDYFWCELNIENCRTVLRNEDFRRLLSTPARTGDTASSGGSNEALGAKRSAHTFTHKQHRAAERPVKKAKPFRQPAPKKEKTETDEIFDESEARLNEIMSKYRDRAAERRKGAMDGADIELNAKLSSNLRTFREEAAREISEADRRAQEIRVRFIALFCV